MNVVYVIVYYFDMSVEILCVMFIDDEEEELEIVFFGIGKEFVYYVFEGIMFYSFCLIIVVVYERDRSLVNLNF